jgi:hypothetical protein
VGQKPGMPTARTVTRSELYELVWDKPMRDLAREFGVSDRGLAKICGRMKISCPARGYWAKKAAGKPVVRRKLSEPESNPSVTIQRSPDFRALREEKVRREAELDESVADAAPLPVAKRLTQPHPVIAGWYEEWERSSENARRQPDPHWRKVFAPTPWAPLDRRAHRLLNALLKRLEESGGKVVEGEKRMLVLEQKGERIEFQIREKTRQVRSPLTPEDPKSTRQRVDLVGIGKLVFAFKTRIPDGFRTEWLETDDKPMEDMLPGIAKTFEQVVPILVEGTRRRREAERQAQIEASRRYEAEQKRRQEHNRVTRFVEHARKWDEIAIARSFLQELKQGVTSPQTMVGGRPLQEWLNWIERTLEDHDPARLGAESIFTDVGDVNSWTYDKRSF